MKISEVNVLRAHLLFFTIIPSNAMQDVNRPTQPQIPLLVQGRILDSLDGTVLSTLGRGLLENDISPLRAKHLIKAAAYKPSPDPLALYLCGYTRLAALTGFVPAMYFCALEWLRLSLNDAPMSIQRPITHLLTTLDQYSFAEATMLPLLQKKAEKAGCSLENDMPKNCPYMQSMQWDKIHPLQAACNMLALLIEHYFTQELRIEEPWAIRACYALALLEQAGLYAHIPTATPAQYLYFTAHKNFEPALWALIGLSLQDNPQQKEAFLTSQTTFLEARNRLRHIVKTQVTQETAERSLQDICIIIDFLRSYRHYAPHAHIFTTSYNNIIEVLNKIIQATNTYKARCILATIELERTTDDAIDKAFETLEPIIYNVQAQRFFAQQINKETQKKLIAQAQDNVHASFLFGIILFSNKETQAQAYTYFTLGAQKKDFYSLCSAASMIRKHFDPNKTVQDSVIYYKHALACAPTVEFKNLVLQTLEHMAQEGCLPAQCQYVIALLNSQENIEKADTIIQSIEALPNKEFERYIMYFKNNCTSQLECLAESGIKCAARLLGYVHYMLAHEQDSQKIRHLHVSLGKLHRYNKTERSRRLAAKIAYTLACHYRQSGNTKNALRLFEIAASYNHTQARSYCALARLQTKTSSNQIQDIQLVEQLAAEGIIEAQKCLAQIYCQELSSITPQHQSPSIIKAQQYLEHIIEQQECEPMYHLLLGKILAQNTCTTDKNKALQLCAQALKLGLTLTEQEAEQFGMLAFETRQDILALKLLEICSRTKPIQLAKALLYLRNQDSQNIHRKKAFQALSECLVIEHDTLTIDPIYAQYVSSLLQELKTTLNDSEYEIMIFLRLCYAYGLEKNFIPHHEFLQLTDKLNPTDSLSSLGFIIFLNRHGIVTNHVIPTILEKYKQILNTEKSESYKNEILEQLTLLAKPVLQRNYYNEPQEAMIKAIQATHALVIQESTSNVSVACLHFCLAEQAITNVFSYDHPMIYTAHILGSVHILADLAKEQNTDAFIATLLFRGYRHLQYPESQEKIDSWLQLSKKFLAQHHTYTQGIGTEHDTLMAMLYTLIGKIELFLKQNSQQARISFEQALAYRPSSDTAQMYIAHMQILDSKSSMTQKRMAIKSLRAQAQNHDPEACYMLGMLHLQKDSPNLTQLHITQDISKAREYLIQATHSYHHQAAEKLMNLRHFF
jgi:TPR repeat protein